MDNSSQFSTPEKQQQLFEKASLLYGVFFDNEKYVEALHTMFLAYVLEMEEEEQERDYVVNAYQNLRHFLRDTEALFNPKNVSNV